MVDTAQQTSGETNDGPTRSWSGWKDGAVGGLIISASAYSKASERLRSAKLEIGAKGGSVVNWWTDHAGQRHGKAFSGGVRVQWS